MENLKFLDLLLDAYLDEPANYGEEYKRIDKELDNIIDQHIKDNETNSKVFWLQNDLIAIVTEKSFYDGFYCAINLLKELKLI